MSFNFAGDFFNEDLRRALRQTVSITIPAQHVDEVVDVAMHAAEQAMATLSRICLAPPDHRVTITSSSVAVGILIHRLGEVQEAMKTAALATGHTYHDATVTVPS